MISDLPGDAGPLDPGLDELFRTLTSGPAPAELAGEQSALAMFRANISPPASPATAPMPAGRPGREANPSVVRPFRRPVGWGMRLAAAVVIVLGLGLAAAAYTAVLPAPVQLLAHRVLGFADVPAPHHHGHVTPPVSHRRRSQSASSGPSGSSPGHARPSHPAPALKPSPTAHKSGTPAASPSPSPSAPTGPAQLSASVSSAEITAGSALVVDGQLTRSGAGAQGVTVQLIERLAGRRLWHLAGSAQTTAGGNVAVTVSAVPANAAFRLRVPGVAHSASVVVIVSPPVNAVLTLGSSGLRDVLAVSTQYAHRGNVVWLEVQARGGGWTDLREQRLNAAGKTAFILSGKRLANLEVRVVLLATLRHGASVSNLVTVPPPT